jgi:hypothetical protein
MNIKKRRAAQIIVLLLLLGGVLIMAFKPSELFGKKLATRSGVVSGIQKVVEERQIGDPHDPMVKDMKAYTYVAQFNLGGAPIVAKFQDPYKINEGDRLTVCGEQNEKFFDVVAYKNETMQYTGSNSWFITAFAGIFFAVFGGFIYFRVIQEPQWYEQLFFLGIFGVGMFLVMRGLYIKEALDLLNQS